MTTHLAATAASRDASLAVVKERGGVSRFFAPPPPVTCTFLR